jgi:outer membrane protein TolC
VDTARSQLAVLLAEPPQAFDPPGDARLPDLEGLPDPGVPLTLLHRRPDLRAAFLRLEAADARSAAAVAERLPGLRLTADLFGQAAEPGSVLEVLLLQVTGLASQTLFDAGRLEARADQAEARARQALYEYARTLLSALQETADALALEGSRARALESLAEQARIGRERLGLARRRYLAGTVPYLEVLTALQALQRTQRELVDARLGRMTQRVNLCRAAAGPLPGLEDDAGLGSVAGRPTPPAAGTAGARSAGAAAPAVGGRGSREAAP